MGGWKDGWMDACMHLETDRSIYRWTDEKIDPSGNGLMDG